MQVMGSVPQHAHAHLNTRMLTPSTHPPARPAPPAPAPPCPWPQRGLTVSQSLLFFEAAAHHMLALGTIFMAIV